VETNGVSKRCCVFWTAGTNGVSKSIVVFDILTVCGNQRCLQKDGVVFGLREPTVPPKDVVVFWIFNSLWNQRCFQKDVVVFRLLYGLRNQRCFKKVLWFLDCETHGVS